MQNKTPIQLYSYLLLVVCKFYQFIIIFSLSLYVTRCALCASFMIVYFNQGGLYLLPIGVLLYFDEYLGFVDAK